MKKSKVVLHGVSGMYVAHDGVEYRPQISTEFKEGEQVTFNLPHKDTGDSWATVTARGVTETWEPQV